MWLLATCLAAACHPATADADIGQSIYHKAGAGLTPAVGITANGQPVLRSPQKFACAACHGIAGQGGSEAGIRPPPIDWNTLAASRTGQGFGKPRPAYDQASLKRALLLGIGASGAPLGNAMPRYSMTDAQFDALHGYLGRIGTPDDLAPGVGPASITLGTVLPMTGPLADTGDVIAAILQARFDAANASGGIYGRRIDLVVADSRGDPDLTTEAIRRLVQDDHVFAVVGSFLPGEHTMLDALLAEAETPLIGPVARAPREREAGSIWYLMPSLADQARVLVDYAQSAAGAAPPHVSLRAAIIYADTPDARDAAHGARAQLASMGATPAPDLMFEPGAFPAEEAARLAIDAGVDWVLFFGGSDAVEAFAGHLPAAPARRPMLAALSLLSSADHLSPASLASIVMAAPAGPAEAAQSAKLTEMLSKSGRAITRPALQANAYAAASVLIEGLTRSGRQLSRAAFTNALEGLRSFDTGVLPPVSFGPDRRTGLRGAVTLHIDPASGLYVPLGNWRPPVSW